MEAKVISVANFKGGVGKTTSTVNLGAALANSRHKVLLIDVDPQANLTQSLGVEADTSIYEGLTGKAPLEPVAVYKGLDVIASSLDLIKAELELAGEFQRESILDRLLEPLRSKYHYILIDCPPSLGLLTINSFVASSNIIIPIEAEYLALRGYKILDEAIGRIGLSITRAFITKYDSRKVLNRNVRESLAAALEDKLCPTVIRNNVALAEAPAKALDIFRYDKNSNGAEDYKHLAKEIAKSL